MILRRNKNLSQKKLASLTGLGVANIARYELDSSMPNTQTLITLSDFFQVSTDYLLKSSGAISFPKDPDLLILMSKIDQFDDDSKIFLKKMINSLIDSQLPKNS